MKVIDLLQRIANGEEVPEKIQVYSDIFVLDYGNKVYEHEKTRTNLLSIYNGNILNYEVKIKKKDKPFNERVEEIYNRYIDYIYDKEDKKIRKIKVDYSPDIEEKIFYEDGDKPRHCVLGDAGTELLINKINEIIDYINGGINGE